MRISLFKREVILYQSLSIKTDKEHAVHRASQSIISNLDFNNNFQIITHEYRLTNPLDFIDKAKINK